MVRPRQEGYVLLCAVWVVALLTVVALGYGRRAWLDYRAAALHVDRLQAASLARGALELGIADLKNQQAAQAYVFDRTRKGYTPVQVPLPKRADAARSFRMRDAAELKDTTCSYVVTDLEGLINVNTAPREILEELGLSFTSVSAILDRRGGGLTHDQRPRPFLSESEVRYVKGVTDVQWRGTKDKVGLRSLISIWGGEGININSAPREVLEALPRMTPLVVEAILQYRMGPDEKDNTHDDLAFRDLEEVAEHTRLQRDRLEPVLRYCKVESEYFRISAIATQRGGKVRATCSAVVQVRGGAVQVLHWQEGDSAP